MARALTDKEKIFLREEFLPQIFAGNAEIAQQKITEFVEKFSSPSSTGNSRTSAPATPTRASSSRADYVSTISRQPSLAVAASSSFVSRDDRRSIISRKSQAAASVISLGSELALPSMLIQLMKMLRSPNELEKFNEFFQRNPDFILIAGDEVDDIIGGDEISSFKENLLKESQKVESRFKFLDELREADQAGFSRIVETKKTEIIDCLSCQNPEFNQIFLQGLRANPGLLASGDNPPLIHKICAQMQDYSSEFIDEFFKIVASNSGAIRDSIREREPSLFQYFIGQRYYSGHNRDKVEKIITNFVRSGFELFPQEFELDEAQRRAKYIEIIFDNGKLHERAKGVALPLVYAKNLLEKTPPDLVLLDLLFSEISPGKKYIELCENSDILEFSYQLYRKNEKLFDEKIDSPSLQKVRIVGGAADKLAKEFDPQFACFALKCALKSHSNSSIARVFSLIPSDRIAEVLSGSNIMLYAVENGLHGNLVLFLKSLREKFGDDRAGFDKIINESNSAGLTAMHLAIKRNMTESIGLLINNGVAIDVKNAEGFTPLMQASKQHSFLVLRKFLESAKQKLEPDNFRILVNHQDDKGRTALHYAAENGREAMVRTLLDVGANAGICDLEGNTAAHLSALSGATITTQLIQERAPEVEYAENLAGKTVEKIITGQKAPTNLANVSEADLNGGTLLHYAIKNSLPLESFIEIFRKCSDPRAALDLALKPNEKGLNALHFACVSASTQNLKNLLRSARGAMKADQFEQFVNHPSAILKMTPLHFLAAHGRERMLHLLSAQYPEVNLAAVDVDGNLALHSAINSGAINSFDMLFSLMFERALDCKQQNSNGENIVHFAARFGDKDLFEAVLATIAKHNPKLVTEMASQVNPHSHKDLMSSLVEAGNDDLIVTLMKYKTVPRFQHLQDAVSRGFRETALLLFDFGVEDFEGKKLPRATSQSDEICTALLERKCKFDSREIELHRAEYPKLFSAYVESEVKKEIKSFSKTSRLISDFSKIFQDPRFNHCTETLNKILPKIVGVQTWLKSEKDSDSHHMKLATISLVRENEEYQKIQNLFSDKKGITKVVRIFDQIKERDKKSLVKEFQEHSKKTQRSTSLEYVSGLEKICEKFLSKYRESSPGLSPSGSSSRQAAGAAWLARSS